MTRDRLEKLRVWLPIIMAGLLVCLAGSDLLSWAKTEHLTRPFLEWLYPEANWWSITLLTFEVRKFGHVALYGFLAILVVRVIVSETRLNSLKASLATLVIVALAAAADETHQALLTSRTGTVVGVVFDLAGATAALLYYWWMKWWIYRFVDEEKTLVPSCSSQS